MTKKQRNREYKRCYESFLTGWPLFVCVELWPKMLNRDSLRFFKATKEFQLFKPEVDEGRYGWWEEEDKESRLNALAFCIAMTE